MLQRGRIEMNFDGLATRRAAVALNNREGCLGEVGGNAHVVTILLPSSYIRLRPSCARCNSSIPISVPLAFRSAALNLIGIAFSSFQTISGLSLLFTIVTFTASRCA